MRTLRYRYRVALTIALGSGEVLACQPPAGFVNPPLPTIAPFDQLLAHTERKIVDKSLSAVMQGAARPLEEAIRPTHDLPGVSGTFRLSDGPYGTPGARRLVCLTDGNYSVEEVLLTESGSDGNRFRYVVWNYTSPKFRDVEYAVGEFVRTQPKPEETHVTWIYRFALKRGADPEQFRKTFLETSFADWMRNVFGTAQLKAQDEP